MDEAQQRIAANRKAINAYRESGSEPITQPCARQHTDGVDSSDSTAELPAVTIQDREDDRWLYGFLAILVFSIPWWIGFYTLMQWMGLL